MSTHQTIRFMAIGFFASPLTWIAIHRLITYKQ